MEAEDTVRQKHRDRVLQLFVEKSVMLSSYLYALVEDWQIVEESLQDTAVYMGSHFEEFTLGTNFGAWARVVSHNRCRELLRRRSRVRGKEVGLNEDLCSLVPDEMWDDSGTFGPRQKQALSSCLEKLPRGHRQLVDMRYSQGKKCSEIAASFKKTVDSMYMALSRIRYRLKQCIERHLALTER